MNKDLIKRFIDGLSSEERKEFMSISDESICLYLRRHGQTAADQLVDELMKQGERLRTGTKEKTP